MIELLNRALAGVIVVSGATLGTAVAVGAESFVVVSFVVLVWALTARALIELFS